MHHCPSFGQSTVAYYQDLFFFPIANFCNRKYMNFATWRLASVAFKQHDLENGGKVFYSIKLTMK